MKTIPDNATHLITAYAGKAHPRANLGVCVGETWHIGQSSVDIEIAAYKRRIARKEISRITVTYLKDSRTDEIYE